MKKFVLVFAAVIAAAVIVLAAYFAFCHNCVYVLEPNVYAGRLLPEDATDSIRFTRSFTLYNPGFKPVKISGITASCGCTNVENPKVVPPLGKVTLEASVEFQASGLIGKSVDVAVKNSSRNPVLMLSLKAEVGNFQTWSPKSLAFGNVTPKSLPEDRIFISQTTPLNAAPKIEVLQKPGNFDISITREKEATIKYRDGSESLFTRTAVSVRMLDCLETGPHKETLKLKADAGSEHTIEIPISWNAGPPCRFSAFTYFFDRENPTQKITVISESRGIIGIEKIEVSDKRFSVSRLKEEEMKAEFSVEYRGNFNKTVDANLKVFFHNGEHISTDLKIL